MSEAEFRAKRRQKFLTEKYFGLNGASIERSLGNKLLVLKQDAEVQEVDPSTQGALFTNKLKLLRLHYTAGAPIESLQPLFADAMKWFDQWHVAYGIRIQALAKESSEELRTDGTPVYFEDLFHFQLAIDVVSLGILLGRPDAVRHAAAWLVRYRGADMLLEALLEKVVADPNTEVTEFFHEQPYGTLIDAIFTAKTPEQASAFVKAYLEGWYKSFDGAPWHDGHLVVTDEYSNYEGYWAFEAAAVCVLYGINDSSFRDHLVYPKDLADWAREHRVLGMIKPGAGAQALRMRCEAGQPCPQTGFWYTPAKLGSRRTFSTGQKMPEIKDTPWGSTIWYWDEQQG